VRSIMPSSPSRKLSLKDFATARRLYDQGCVGKIRCCLTSGGSAGDPARWHHRPLAVLPLQLWRYPRRASTGCSCSTAEIARLIVARSYRNDLHP
jgi:hypothetical protein